MTRVQSAFAVCGVLRGSTRYATAGIGKGMVAAPGLLSIFVFWIFVFWFVCSEGVGVLYSEYARATVATKKQRIVCLNTAKKNVTACMKYCQDLSHWKVYHI